MKGEQEADQAAEAAKEEPRAAAGEESKPAGYSYPYPTILFVYFLLFLLIPAGQGNWWGYFLHAAYWALMCFCFWTGTSRKEYEQIRTKYPTLNRSTWALNWIIFPVLLPLLAWLVLGLPAILRSLPD